MILQGKAHTFKRAHINTDEIIPARYLNTDNEKELALHAMEDIDKTFVENIQEGDFIVSSTDFGCGSSREHAIWALRGAGVRAVIAETFARIFYRNCINNGFVPIELEGAADKITTGDELVIDLEKGTIENKTKNETYEFISFPKFVMDMINCGGLLNKVLLNCNGDDE